MSPPGPGPDAVLSETAPAGPSAAGAPARAAEDRGAQRSVNPFALALLAVAVLALVYGLVLRLWLLVQVPLWGDEAVIGLMARAIDGGHFTAFIWGQHYGGLESYVTALVLKVAGGGERALNATPALLCALGAVLVGGITYAAGRNRPVALAAAGAAWVWPYVVIWQSVREQGFREATLCCGLAALLCCVRIFRRRAGPGTFLVLGLALGLGWWASPEIVYFVVPSAVLVAAWWWGTRRGVAGDPSATDVAPTRWVAAVLVVGGGLVGSIPWWYANAHTSFASLRSSSFPANSGATYGGRLSVFFHYMLPMQLGVRTVLTGAWVGGTAVGKLLYAVVLLLIAAAAVRAVWVAARTRSEFVPLALAAAIVVYPFLYAAAPGTAYWNDGRYGIYLPTFVVLLFASALLTLRVEAPQGRGGQAASPVRRSALVVGAVGVLGALCLTVAGARTAGVPTGFFTSWPDGDAPMQHVVDTMRADHITAAYGDYWTSYDLDFLSGGSPTFSPSPLDVNRSTAISSAVASTKNPAWLFFAPNQTAEATTVFGNPQPGPGPYTQQTFEAYLTKLGIPYKVVQLGVLNAVIPQRPLPPL